MLVIAILHFDPFCPMLSPKNKHLPHRPKQPPGKPKPAYLFLTLTARSLTGSL